MRFIKWTEEKKQQFANKSWRCSPNKITGLHSWNHDSRAMSIQWAIPFFSKKKMQTFAMTIITIQSLGHMPQMVVATSVHKSVCVFFLEFAFNVPVYFIFVTILVDIICFTINSTLLNVVHRMQFLSVETNSMHTLSYDLCLTCDLQSHKHSY